MLVYTYTYTQLKIDIFNFGFIRDSNLIPFYFFGNFLHMIFDIRRKTYMKRMLGYVSVHINIYAAQNRHFHLRPCKRYQFNFFLLFWKFFVHGFLYKTEDIYQAYVKLC